jgi:phage FluMu protein Com
MLKVGNCICGLKLNIDTNKGGFRCPRCKTIQSWTEFKESEFTPKTPKPRSYKERGRGYRVNKLNKGRIYI